MCFLTDELYYLESALTIHGGNDSFYYYLIWEILSVDLSYTNSNSYNVIRWELLSLQINRAR